MKNLRLYETEVDYTSDPITREYPTVSYIRDIDSTYYEANTPSTIKFQVIVRASDIREFTADYGMTWAEWINSDYNTDEWEIIDGRIYLYFCENAFGGTYEYIGLENSTMDQYRVYDTDTIIGQTYYVVSDGWGINC